MSYQPAYTTRFPSLDGTLWEIVIYIDGHAASPLEISLEGDEPCVIDWQETGKTDVVQSSACTLRVSNESDRQMAQLMGHPDAAVMVSRDGRPYWFGHLDDAVYEEPYSYMQGYVTELTFSDFGILNRIPFALKGKQSVGAIVRYCLESTGYGNGATVNLLTSLLVPETQRPVTLDMLYVNADRFESDDGSWGKMTSKREVLEEILRPLGLRIMQKNGQVYIYDIEYLRDHDDFHDYPVWKGTDAYLRGSETFGWFEVAFAPDALETLAEDGLDHDASQWDDDSEGYLAKSYDPVTGTDSDTGFYLETMDHALGAKVQKSANARYFRTRPVFTDSSDIGVAWRIECRKVIGHANMGGFHVPLTNDCILVGNSPAPSLADTSEVLAVETGYLPIVPDAGKYQLRVNLDTLLSFRPNPLDDPPDEWVEQQGWYHNAPMGFMEKGWRSKGLAVLAVPVRLEVLDEAGNAAWHYVNAYVEDVDVVPFGSPGPVPAAMVHPSGVGNGKWMQGAGDWRSMILSYYKDYDEEEADRDPLVNSGWVGNRISVSAFNQHMGTLYLRRSDGEYLPLPPAAGRLRLTVGSGVFVAGGDADLRRDLYPCYRNFAWHLFRNPKITLVKASRRDDAIGTDAVHERHMTNPAADRLSEEVQAGTWQKGVAPSARGLLFDSSGVVWEKLCKNGSARTLQQHRLRCIEDQTSFTQPVISGTAELNAGFCAYRDWSTPGIFLVTAIRQDLHQGTEQLTMARIANVGAFAYEAAWGNPACALEEEPYTFAWTKAVCAEVAGPFRHTWTKAVCVTRYVYTLEWSEMDQTTDRNND